MKVKDEKDDIGLMTKFKAFGPASDKSFRRERFYQ